ncbi:DUF4179 domain-containing protein [Alkalihalobacterium bogoriense]|uniref:DUF4179 domain-containing protein n=1 Tax=Alkalihalobacterium bogoriense TaxID=246272 RepID=UPI00047CD47C|nr:DUF4179 domain-containing protein [Alkalihalobacterium bogoriense]
MDKLEQMLKKAKTDASAQVPTSISEGIDSVLETLPKKRKKKQMLMVYTASSIVIGIGVILGASQVSPSVSQGMQKLPIIGSVFEFVSDKGLNKAQEQELTNKVDKQIVSGDTTLTFTDVFHDGTRLSVGYVMEGVSSEQDVRNTFYDETFTLKIDGQKIYNLNYMRISVTKMDDNQFIGVLELTNRNFPDSFELTLDFYNIDSKKGEWSLSFPVIKTKDIFHYQVNAEQEVGDYDVRINEVTLTPATTELKYTVFQEVKGETVEGLIPSLLLFDDKGRQYKHGAGGSKGGMNVLPNGTGITQAFEQYEPMEEKPEYIVVQPYMIGNGNSNVSSGELGSTIPLKLEQGEKGSLTVLDVTSNQDDLIITYQVEGTLPFYQAWVWLEDRDGNETYSTQAPQLVDRESYTFTQRFSNIDIDNISQYKIHTNDLENITLYPETIKITLE